jgi:hypothetical protein
LSSGIVTERHDTPRVGTKRWQCRQFVGHVGIKIRRWPTGFKNGGNCVLGFSAELLTDTQSAGSPSVLAGGLARRLDGNRDHRSESGSGMN